MFVVHVTMHDGKLAFSPSVKEITEAWGQFCDVLSVAAYRSLHSSLIVFELLKQQIVSIDQNQQEHIPTIRVRNI